MMKVPDPLPDHEVSGFPISIEFSDYCTVSLKRLDYSAEYKVAVHYKTKNKEHTITWNFKILELIEKLHIIKNKNATIHLAKGKSHILYLPPT